MTQITIFLFSVLIVSSFCFTLQTQQQQLVEQVGGIPWPFTLCGEADWNIETVTLDQTPKRNINDDIDVTGTAKKAIGFKRVEINVKLNGVFLDKEVIEFTSSYDSGDTVEFTYKNFIPSFAPIGNYGLTFNFFDSKDNINGCLQFQFKI